MSEKSIAALSVRSAYGNRHVSVRDTVLTLSSRRLNMLTQAEALKRRAGPLATRDHGVNYLQGYRISRPYPQKISCFVDVGACA